MHTGWRRPIDALNCRSISAKEPLIIKLFLRKMTSRDKASCGFSPPCRACLANSFLKFLFWGGGRANRSFWGGRGKFLELDGTCESHLLMTAHCNSLQHTATHCNTLQHTATHCNTQSCICWWLAPDSHDSLNILQHTATHCNTLQHTATHCNTLRHTATAPFGSWLAWVQLIACVSVLQYECCSVLQCVAVCCSVLQCVADCSMWVLHEPTAHDSHDSLNTLKHIAAHCNTLQHTATHCNTLQHSHCNTHTAMQHLLCNTHIATRTLRTDQFSELSMTCEFVFAELACVSFNTLQHT